MHEFYNVKHSLINILHVVGTSNCTDLFSSISFICCRWMLLLLKDELARRVELFLGYIFQTLA